MAQKEYNVGDVLLNLDETSKFIFVKITNKYEVQGLIHFHLTPLLMEDCEWPRMTTSLLFLEKQYVKVEESTVKILFGDKDGKEKATPENSSK